MAQNLRESLLSFLENEMKSSTEDLDRINTLQALPLVDTSGLLESQMDGLNMPIVLFFVFFKTASFSLKCAILSSTLMIGGSMSLTYCFFWASVIVFLELILNSAVLCFKCSNRLKGPSMLSFRTLAITLSDFILYISLWQYFSNNFGIDILIIAISVYFPLSFLIIFDQNFCLSFWLTVPHAISKLQMLLIALTLRFKFKVTWQKMTIVYRLFYFLMYNLSVAAFPLFIVFAISLLTYRRKTVDFLLLGSLVGPVTAFSTYFFFAGKFVERIVELFSQGFFDVNRHETQVDEILGLISGMMCYSALISIGVTILSLLAFAQLLRLSHLNERD